MGNFNPYNSNINLNLTTWKKYNFTNLRINERKLIEI